MPAHLPLLVTVELRGPYIDRGDPLHLDGILGMAHARRHGRARHYRPPTRVEPAPTAEQHLPLTKFAYDGHWIWLASAAEEIGPAAPAVVHQTRRRDPEDWGWLDRPVKVAAGPTKDCLVRREARVVRGLKWRAHGHRREVVRSLRLLWGREDSPHGLLGSARRSGAGQIARWRVEVADFPIEEIIASPEGRARRHLPHSWTDAGTARRGAYRAPYWHPERQVRVCEVGQPVTVSPHVLHGLARAA